MITLTPITPDCPYYDESQPGQCAIGLRFESDHTTGTCYVDITVDDEDPDSVVLRVYDSTSITCHVLEDGSEFHFDREPIDAYQGTLDQLHALTLPITYTQLEEWYHLGH